jgi:hypothetical protein
MIEFSEIREEILKWIEANPGLKISDFQHQGLLTLESIKAAIESIEKEEDNSYINSKLHMDLNYWKKIKTKSQGISDLNARYDYLINEKQEFMSLNRGSEADIIITWFTDEIERIKLLISSSNANENTSSFSDSLYDLLHIADAGLHNKDYSCTSYYSNINFYFEKFKSEFQNLFSRIQKDKEIIFIDSYINEIKRYSKDFSSCYSLEALEFFNKEKLTFDNFGSYSIIVTDDNKERKCKLFHYNFDHLREMAVDWEYIDLSRSVICYIADHFISKTFEFLEQYRITTTNVSQLSKEIIDLKNYALNRYLEEIQTLEIKVFSLDFKNIEHRIRYNIPSDYVSNVPILKLLDLSHYNSKKSDYDNHMKRLQQEALTEISFLSTEQLTNQLKRIEQIENRLSVAYNLYHEFSDSFSSNKLTALDIDMKLPAFFIVPPHNDGQITQDFLYDMQDALMYKHGSIKGFISQIKKLIGIPEKEILQNQPLPLPQKAKVPYAFNYFKYAKNYTALYSLLNFLIDNGFISSKSSKSDFGKIFNNKLPKKSIQWLDGIESLCYFIKLLHRDYKLIEPIKPIWKVTSGLFVDENNDFFESNKFKGQKVPSTLKAKLLNDAIDYLK